MSKRPRVPRPDPEIYRRAAELVATGGEGFTCFAIEKAMRQPTRQTSVDVTSLYKAQYAVMFASHIVKGEVRSTSCWGHPRWGFRTSFKDDFLKDATHPRFCKHPYWSKAPTKRRQEYRVMALLFMAEMVANP